MSELIGILICSALGFAIGGVVGEVQLHTWFPYAWIGLGIGFLIGVSAVTGCACFLADVICDIVD